MDQHGSQSQGWLPSIDEVSESPCMTEACGTPSHELKSGDLPCLLALSPTQASPRRRTINTQPHQNIEQRKGNRKATNHSTNNKSSSKGRAIRWRSLSARLLPHKAKHLHWFRGSAPSCHCLAVCTLSTMSCACLEPSTKSTIGLCWG